ncbi:CobW family GTP-binding protein [Eubacterium barkeri]|uniref:GTPase, G3E family n=1 Tax=Eubacterium barkeri TaxID=1528 RepID=A0A1H3EYE8_EUBBA|nr:CobW family GTP-binding protein [Eubacterium barkeri]SDX83630.1 GTPase, G3E family [Eubacterium barkeri]
MKLVLLTGFLGAGKTTLLNMLLTGTQGMRVGILMNELGAIDIDSRLIQTKDSRMVSLTNGSVFCACLKQDFIKGLIDLLKLDLEIVFVESSGISDPSNMQTILGTVSKVSGQSYDYNGAVCLVDAVGFFNQYEVLPAIQRQIVHSDLAIINKCDRQTEAALECIKGEIQSIHPEMPCIQTTYCQLDPTIFLEKFKHTPAVEAETTNTWESRPKTIVLKVESTPLPLGGLQNFLVDIAPYTFRIKGFLATEQGNMAISAVGKEIQSTPWATRVEGNELVIISAIGVSIISRIIGSWQHFLPDCKMDLEPTSP